MYIYIHTYTHIFVYTCIHIYTSYHFQLLEYLGHPQSHLLYFSLHFFLFHSHTSIRVIISRASFEKKSLVGVFRSS